jgi:hypothetical protein
MNRDFIIKIIAMFILSVLILKLICKSPYESFNEGFSFKSIIDWFMALIGMGSSADDTTENDTPGGTVENDTPPPVIVSRGGTEAEQSMTITTPITKQTSFPISVPFDAAIGYNLTCWVKISSSTTSWILFRKLKTVTSGSSKAANFEMSHDKHPALMTQKYDLVGVITFLDSANKETTRLINKSSANDISSSSSKWKFHDKHWTNISWNQSGPTTTIYVNNSKLFSKTFSGLKLNKVDHPIWINERPGHISIKNLKFTNYPLTDAEITNLYNTTKP